MKEPVAVAQVITAKVVTLVQHQREKLVLEVLAVAVEDAQAFLWGVVEEQVEQAEMVSLCSLHRRNNYGINI
jgi:hypothetical protein